jgi:hypothetical protein
MSDVMTSIEHEHIIRRDGVNSPFLLPESRDEADGGFLWVTIVLDVNKIT